MIANPNTKKLFNRAGIILVALGVVANFLGGGDTSQLIGTIELASPILGGLSVLLRELLN
jgi:hypothetical protein